MNLPIATGLILSKKAIWKCWQLDSWIKESEKLTIGTKQCFPTRGNSWWSLTVFCFTITGLKLGNWEKTGGKTEYHISKFKCRLFLYWFSSIAPYFLNEYFRFSMLPVLSILGKPRCEGIFVSFLPESFMSGLKGWVLGTSLTQRTRCPVHSHLSHQPCCPCVWLVMTWRH